MAPVAVAVAAAIIAAGSGTASADTPRQSEWWLAKLHITEAQKISQGSGVTIAVLSTGTETAAPDIRGSVTNGPDLSNSSRSPGGPFYGLQEAVHLMSGELTNQLHRTMIWLANQKTHGPAGGERPALRSKSSRWKWKFEPGVYGSH